MEPYGILFIIITNHYIFRTTHILSKDNPYDALVAKKLSDKTIERWESFYDSIVQSRSPENLKVAYLSGPNPENDLRVFCNAGVLPENIWAFESDNKIYPTALKSALKSEFPFIKIINGGLDMFIEASPQRFDIIYLDFCGPLPSRKKKQKTILALTKILAKHALNSPGVLITNFALPTIEDETGRSLLSKLVSCYLYPKAFVENEDSESGFSEGAVAQGLDTDEWFKKVSNDLDYYYGQFVTRLLIDHASLISPYNRFPKKKSFLYTKFFNAYERSLLSLSTRKNSYFHFDEEDKGGGGNVIVDSDLHPILWTLAALDKELNGGDCNYPQFIFEDEDFAKFAELFLSQLDVNSTKKELIDSFFTISFLLAEGNGQEEFWSKELKELYEKHSFRDFYQFCDLLLFHQIFEALFRQVAVPYHVNISETKRWSYKAKDTPMYMDMMILDECRYLYDWMPTTDMFLSGISDIERQLSYRFALDGVAKHIRWYNPEYFFGTAVVDQFTKGFEAKTLKPRETIKN
ncbi:hypothetical protein [Laspinema olomoucense]|uniref:hypothetical protein n=1 Tax=Laspinema olomoucense TaxID=3231600 RepID=UPI0021BAB114|nr:hypothetical protein [Laspinema sp. D3a]MCT7991973.1 hypothetical protein [Laspinema sp. D3a]